MNCYAWELEALLEGAMLREVDYRELLAINLFNGRYVENAKKPQLKKVFNKTREEARIVDIFTGKQLKSKLNTRPGAQEFLARQKALSRKLAGRST